jgi:hypothetical protein
MERAVDAAQICKDGVGIKILHRYYDITPLLRGL